MTSNVFIFKNLGDGGLMSQGRAAELPVTTDTNVPFTPATLFFIFFFHSLISIIMIIMTKVPFTPATVFPSFDH